MPNDLQYLIQITDKWSKRRFALKLRKHDEFLTISSFNKFLSSVDKSTIECLVKDELISDNGVQGLEDVRCSMFNLDDSGNILNLIDGIQLKQQGRALKDDDKLKFEHKVTGKEGYSDIYVADIILDRDNVLYTRNWKGFYKRNWKKDEKYNSFIEEIIENQYPEKAEQVLSLKTKTDKIDFLKAVSEILFNAPYEIYSRFIDRNLRYKRGPETLNYVINGHGGNCSEKAAAFEFIATNFGIETKLILAGNNADKEFPYTLLKRALDNYDFQFKDNAQRYWSHFANSFEVEGTRILVDATGGPIPFLFKLDEETDQFFSREKNLELWFIAEKENYFYHDAPQDISYGALYSLEAFVPDSDIYHVLGDEEEDSPFGFIITKDFWVCPSPYQTESEFKQYKDDWLEWGGECENIKNIEVYKNMDPAEDKVILSKMNTLYPFLIANLRTAESNFVQRIRQSWKDESWNSGIVFAEFKNS